MIDELLTRAQRQDAAAFDALVRAHQCMVYSIAFHFFRNEAWAEEIAQDVFLELFRGLSSITSPAHLKSWLRRSAMCRCIDLSRKRGHRKELPLLDFPTADPRQRPNDVLAAEWLRRSVAKLPDQQRAVIILRYTEELEPSEIADLLGLPVNTIKSRLHRALESLRSRFPKQEEHAV